MINRSFLLKNIPTDWKFIVEKEINKKYFDEIIKEINLSYQKQILQPSPEKIFRAFEKTNFKSLKMVILGQDPYHGVNQANGLSFAVEKEFKTPPSLKNIFKEIFLDTKEISKAAKNLEFWASQGILLLNSILTVNQNLANSHKKIGWDQFTNKVLKGISNHKKNIVFFLWGKNAQKKRVFIDPNHHLILTTSHPSPLSVYRGFKGCKHFSIANNYLQKNHIKGIIW